MIRLRHSLEVLAVDLEDQMNDHLLATLSQNQKLLSLNLGNAVLSMKHLTLICLNKPFGFTFTTSDRSLLTLEQAYKMCWECCPKGGRIVGKVKCMQKNLIPRLSDILLPPAIVV